jgi:hypothetical protein
MVITETGRKQIGPLTWPRAHGATGAGPVEIPVTLPQRFRRIIQNSLPSEMMQCCQLQQLYRLQPLMLHDHRHVSFQLHLDIYIYIYMYIYIYICVAEVAGNKLPADPTK